VAMSQVMDYNKQWHVGVAGLVENKMDSDRRPGDTNMTTTTQAPTATSSKPMLLVPYDEPVGHCRHLGVTHGCTCQPGWIPYCDAVMNAFVTWDLACYCTKPCSHKSHCPGPPSGNANQYCDRYGYCRLGCANFKKCPTGMRCVLDASATIDCVWFAK
ncbi:hypothetical protein FOL47_009352, partial [Perkinsus chesapeaki]